jgi:tetratricopeptide (TPR) repeat protein
LYSTLGLAYPALSAFPMQMRSGPTLFVWLVMSAVPALVAANDLSQVYTARGEVAYARGQYTDALNAFVRAVEADPNDADAQYALGTALAKLERWDEAEAAFERAARLRPGFAQAIEARDMARKHIGLGLDTREATEVAEGEPTVSRKRWELHATTGFQYDSNVVLAPRGHTRGGVSERGDEAFIFSGGGRYDVIDREDALLRVEYDLYQTLHLEIDDFDFRSHRGRATGSYAVVPWLWIGAQSGYNHFTLGNHSYLSEPFVMPFLSYIGGNWGVAQLSYRYAHDTFLSDPFHDVRDGPTNQVSLSQTFYLGGARALTFGYTWGNENPERSAGNDYELVFNQGWIDYTFPLWWDIQADLMYLYRYDDYTEPNSTVNFTKTRSDNEHHMFASFKRPITEHLSTSLVYFGTVNPSNIQIFDYRRNVVALLLTVSY